MKDYQRSRVYSLDDRLMYAACIADESTYKDELTLQEMQNIAGQIFGTNAPEVKDGRRCRRALADGSEEGAWIKMPRWARNSVVLCHELSHIFISRNYYQKVPAHGAEYMAVYKEMLIRLGILDEATIDRLAKSEQVDIAPLAVSPFVG